VPWEASERAWALQASAERSSASLRGGGRRSWESLVAGGGGGRGELPAPPSPSPSSASASALARPFSSSVRAANIKLRAAAAVAAMATFRSSGSAEKWWRSVATAFGEDHHRDDRSPPPSSASPRLPFPSAAFSSSSSSSAACFQKTRAASLMLAGGTPPSCASAKARSAAHSRECRPMAAAAGPPAAPRPFQSRRCAAALAYRATLHLEQRMSGGSPSPRSDNEPLHRSRSPAGSESTASKGSKAGGRSSEPGETGRA